MEWNAQAKAPGKVIICGEHAVVHGSAAVAAAIGLYTDSRVSHGRPDSSICLELAHWNLQIKWPLTLIKSAIGEQQVDQTVVKSCSSQLMIALRLLVEEQHPEGLDAGVETGIIAFLFLYMSIVGLQPALVSIKSNLPMGCGLGSSAAYCVALCASLLAYTKSLQQKGDRGEWVSVSDGDLDLVNKWALEGEKIIHGKASGIDNTVCTFGNVLQYKNGHITHLRDLPLLRILITNTKVKRNTKQLVAAVRVRYDQHKQMMKHLFDATDCISNELVELLHCNKNTTENDELHIKLEELLEINQGLLESMGVSHPSIRNICEITLKHGLKSKLTGGGGGGCVITLLPKAATVELLEKVTADIRSAGFECFEADVGCAGVQIMY